MEAAQTGRTFFALGTINSIQVFAEDGGRAADAAMKRVLQIHERMSVFREGSDLSNLNAAAGRKGVPVHPDTLSLLLLAQKCARITNGAFDITLRPLSSLWNVGKAGSRIPPHSRIIEALAFKGMEDLEIDPETSVARLARPGQSVDLGGIAKGYAGDEVRRILLEHGVASALVNLGGNIVAMGVNPEGRPWKIGVQNPLRPRGESLAVLEARDASVVTSGAGERFFLKDGKRYHHILDPKTGAPAGSGLLSVTVISPSGALADALSTALFVLGTDEGLALLRSDPEGFFSGAGIQALFVKEDLSLAAAPGLSYAPLSSTEVQ